MSLNIKTFVTRAPEEMDKEVNAFGNEHVVRATQTDMCFVVDHVQYRATVFYEK